MTKKATIGAVVYYNNNYYKVSGIGEGKTYILEKIAKEPPCPTCGRSDEKPHILEHSMIWEQDVVAVATLTQ